MKNIMKKTKLSTAFLLALLLLSSCYNGTSTDIQETSDSIEESTEQTTATTEESRVYPELPDKDYGGEEFRISTFSLWGDDYVYAEELNGNVLNDAIFMRNSLIEEKYNVDIIVDIYERDYGSVTNHVRQSVSSGDASVDIGMTVCWDAANLMLEGYLMQLETIPYVDTSMPWWDQSSLHDLSIGGKTYFALNSLNIMADNFTSAVFFNKDMLTDLNLDNPYVLVDENKWTWEKMLSMAEVASVDTDGDGEMTDLDTWGAVASFGIMKEAMTHSGELIILKDADDYPVLGLSTERSATACEKLLNLLSDDKTVLMVDKYSSKYNDAWQDLMYPTFKNGKALFIARGFVQYVIYFRDSEVNYGILPRPKFDSAQDRYYSVVNYTWASTITVPCVLKDAERTGIILEALAAESLYTVTPANYDISIVNKQLRDVESERMLEIIYSSRCFDYGEILGLSGMNNKFTSMIQSGNFTFASDYAAAKSATDASIEKVIEKINKLEN